MYIYTIIAHSLFEPGFSIKDSADLVNTDWVNLELNKDPTPESSCDTLFHCLWTVINTGFRSGGGIGDLM